MKKRKMIEDKDIYTNIRKYQSFLYKNTEFFYKGNKEEIKKIVKALNIKSKMKRLEYIYDECCLEIDKKFENRNICGFHCGQCRVQQKRNFNEVNGCCKICQFQSDTGCKTKNLSCKLFFCDEIKEHYEVVKLSDITLSKLFSWRQKLMLKCEMFSLKEAVLMDLYMGSLVICASRQLLTLIKMAFYLLFKHKKQFAKSRKLSGKVIIVSLIFTMLFCYAVSYPLILVAIIFIGMLQQYVSKIYKLNSRSLDKIN